MCGITGFVDWNKNSDARILTKMNDALVHRGPDGFGTEIFESVHGQVGFGHRRLAIIDLSENGKQPMFSEDRRYCIILNGEIYNFKEIRETLINDGDEFFSGSDTEVVLKAYRRWGLKAVDRFIGMFVFVIYDQIENSIIIFRDRAGVKPLYYYKDKDLFLFASELKSFHQHPGFIKRINQDAVALFFRHGYIDSPHCIFDKCFKLQPGHFLKLTIENRKFEIQKYWDCFDYYNLEKFDITYTEATKELESLLHSAFHYRMVSDVPVGVFLSSGYDSSTVAAILSQSQKINTYTIGFDESRYDESKNAAAIASHLNTNHHTLYAVEDNIGKIIEELVYYYDEPFGDSSAIPSCLVSQLAKENVTVALSADGGDELFAGYPKHYQHFNLYYYFSKIPNFVRIPFRMLSRFSKFKHRENLFNSKTTNDVLKSKLETIVFTNNELCEMLTYDYNLPKTSFDTFNDLNENVGFLDKLLAVDYKTYLENDILVKMDRATMSASLEGREPFLDHRILEFAARLPESYKYEKEISKKILKDINKNYIPTNLMNSSKMGFGGPLTKWLNSVMYDDLKRLMSSESFPSHILNHAYLNNLVFYDFFNGSKKVWWYKVYQIYVFLKWHEKWN